ncbi:metallophosphoesterase family protein [Marinimicrobium agarilyticum]|uniref:metallophosphoesterase family protein n=1 Tax=Marinimicrobium agarilyticum TaxID=306546 RepID=UPI000422FD1B|nr:metallophosphoesterase [Marinimicrobium agarilyticum]
MRYSIVLYLVLLLVSCGGSDSPSGETPNQPAPPPGEDQEPPEPTDSDTGGNPPAEETPLRVGLLPDTQGGGDNVSIHPMEAVLSKLDSMDVDIVIAVGDLTDHGTTKEFEQWTSVAEKYREAGVEFLPLMGNHEDSYAYTVEWIDNMKDYIPEDAVHMSGAEYLDYYVVRDNVLIIALRYYHLPIAFQWMKGVINEHRDSVDHIVIASHDGLIGAKYGETREQIVEGVAGPNRLLDQWDDIRDFFSKNDVIWVQGHEHMYQRSVVKAPIGLDAGSWEKNNRNYRLPQYTQIMSGNASYKGYEFRYGERELVQAIVQQKMNTMANGSEAFDANAGMLTFTGKRVDFETYFTEHTVTANEEGPKELADPEWHLLDRFSRTLDRCERLVYANTIPEGTRPVMVLDPLYRTNECYAADGSVAELIDGTNDTFNRVESRTRTLSWTEGFSIAQSQSELMRMAYQYLFQFSQPWTPNLNGENRIVPSMDDASEVEVPETTIDLKEHVMLSWMPATSETVSDILLVSGTQNQTGTYSSAYGAPKDIEADTGLPGSQPDGSAKAPVVLPETASQSWDLATAVSDVYVLQFYAPESEDPAQLTLGVKTEDGDWVAMADASCVIEATYNPEYLVQMPEREANCGDEPLVGYDANHGGRWWAVLNADVEVALVQK